MRSTQAFESAIADGGPGWHRTRLERVFRWVAVVVGAVILVAGLVDPAGGLGRTVAVPGLGALIVVLGFPLPAGRATPYETVEDGVPATAIPVRPPPWRIVVVLILIGVLLVLGGTVGGAQAFRDGETAKGLGGILAGALFGIGLLGLGIAGVRRRARRPRPILLTPDELRGTWAGKWQGIPWDDVGVVEKWWTWRGIQWPRTHSNDVLVRDLAGSPVVAFPVTTLACDPEEALALIRARHAAHGRPDAFRP